MTWNSQFLTSLSLDSLLWALLAVSSLLLLAGLFVGNIDDVSDGLDLLKLRRKTTASSGSGSSASWPFEVLYLSQRFLHGSLLAKIMVSTYLMISVVGFAVSTQHPAVYADHNVSVMGVSKDQHTLLLDSPTRGSYQLVICHDLRNSRVMMDVNPQPQYRLDQLIWESTGRGCSNVANETALTGPLGFWWHKVDGVVVKLTIAKEN